MDSRAREQAAQAGKRAGGYTLVEAAIVIAIIGIVSALTLPNVSRYMETSNGRAAAKSVADAFNLARAQAIRTGNNHVVFFATVSARDTAGNQLQDHDGDLVPILVLNDGRPGSTDQNCVIDASEEKTTFPAVQGVGWGRNTAPSGSPAPDEAQPSIPASGSSFQMPGGSLTSWVQFRPDGVPVAIDSACSPGQLGTGGGTIYLWTENRDYAITLSPLGGVRVHVWDENAGGWTS